MAVSESPAVRNFKSALWIGVVVMGLFVVYKIVPPYFHNYQFEDAVATEAKFGAYNQKSEEQVRDTIMKKAVENDIQLTPEQVKVVKGSTDIVIDVNYTVHVDIPFYPVDLEFHPSSRNKQL